MTTTPSKQKGTGGEREAKILLEQAGYEVVRNPASAGTDLTALSRNRLKPGHPKIPALMTRPDHGRWLITMPAEALAWYLYRVGADLDVEVKRYRRFGLHTIFEDKFGRNR